MADLSSLMAALTFYRQKRVDGGIRTGIMLGETSVREHFDEGPGEYDPSLLWSVDLRCDGPNLPQTAQAAQQWLLDNQGVIREGFARYADHLGAGSDPTGPYLLQWSDFPGGPPDVQMTIVCGAMRRFDARSLAGVLADVGARWESLILSLTPGQPAMQ